MHAPSATQTFKTCQRLYALQQLGWRSNYVGFPNLAASVGNGVHAGAECLHAHLLGHEHQLPDADWLEDSLKVSVTVGKASIQRLIEAGAYPVERVEDWEERLTLQVEGGVRAYVKGYETLMAPVMQVVSYEEAWGFKRGEQGYEGRLDLLVEDQWGLAVVDIKTKQPFRTEYYKEMFLGEFCYSWQMYSYLHSVLRHRGELPKRFYLVMIEMKAKPVMTLHAYRVDETYYQQWLYAVSQIWDVMDDVGNGKVVPSINDSHYFYGKPCAYKRACLEYGLDEGRMLQDYVQIGGDD